MKTNNVITILTMCVVVVFAGCDMPTSSNEKTSNIEDEIPAPEDFGVEINAEIIERTIAVEADVVAGIVNANHNRITVSMPTEMSERVKNVKATITQASHGFPHMVLITAEGVGVTWAPDSITATLSGADGGVVANNVYMETRTDPIAVDGAVTRNVLLPNGRIVWAGMVFGSSGTGLSDVTEITVEMETSELAAPETAEVIDGIMEDVIPTQITAIYDGGNVVGQTVTIAKPQNPPEPTNTIVFIAEDSDGYPVALSVVETGDMEDDGDQYTATLTTLVPETTSLLRAVLYAE